jgi:hypothetical protein
MNNNGHVKQIFWRIIGVLYGLWNIRIIANGSAFPSSSSRSSRLRGQQEFGLPRRREGREELPFPD